MSSETILIFGKEGKTLKLFNHLVIAAFGAGFSSHCSVDVLVEANTNPAVCALWELAAQDLSCAGSLAVCD